MSVPDTATVLARAFHNDAMFTYIEPDEQRRAKVLPWFFGAAARLGAKYGRIDVDPGRAAAIWLPPGKTDLGPRALVGSGFAAAPLRLGIGGFRRFGSITSAFDAAKVTVIAPPFWHLFILGVEPSEQGCGHGGRVIAPVLAQADRDGHRCYLETTEESNLAFYRRRGFEVSSDHAPAGLPAFWTMTRQPG
ncbi:GNAT family N-acetyltransferase [Antrihabitans stalactiti]|uniref:GNAT family N-acetyltransferase n=1 Tax=Antrihabitans stalactiti TaxID=2584121 RepID=A0A848KGA5_9NOCA|nr:GNAT family N-acetyltransferase [Antrihabitans stalactiti]NMN95742.1 GNAT family N-acetyltransferase [Antrihabitans stalactiti]